MGLVLHRGGEVREDGKVVRCGVWTGDDLAVYAVHPCGQVVLTHHITFWGVPPWYPEGDDNDD